MMIDGLHRSSSGSARFPAAKPHSPYICRVISDKLSNAADPLSMMEVQWSECSNGIW